MDLRELVRACLSYDALVARQWVADSRRQGVVWTLKRKPCIRIYCIHAYPLDICQPAEYPPANENGNLPSRYLV